MSKLHRLISDAIEQRNRQRARERYTEDNFWRVHSPVTNRTIHDAGRELAPPAPELLLISTGTHDRTWKNGGALYRSTLVKFVCAHTEAELC